MKGTAAADRLNRLASLCSLTLAVTLIGVKVWAWLATGSMAMLTAAIDSVVDAGAALATFAGVRYAARPADREHRFGHGKGEALAAFVQAMFLAGAAVTLAFQSGERLLDPEPVAHLDLGLWVIVASTLATAALVTLQAWVALRTGSTAIAADKAHYLTDIAVNLAVLTAFIVTGLTGWARADPSFALAISGYMLWNVRAIARDALAQLLDRELGPEDRRRIHDAVLACAEVRAIHDLRTRDAGDRVFVEFHLEVDGDLTVTHGHAISEAAEAAVAALFPAGAEVTVHIEPAGIDDRRLDAMVHKAAG
jgi:cation diffusion facilitator family transporter